MESKEEQSPAQKGNQPGRIGRRQFLTKVVPAALVTAAAIATPPIAKELIFGGGKENTELPPTFEDVEKAVNHAYKISGKEIPENILERLPVCNEQKTVTRDPVREVLHSCGEVGGGINNLIKDTKDNEIRNQLISDLKTVERFTYAKMDEYTAQGRLPDKKNIDSFKQQFKEIYFTVPIKE